MCKVVGIVQDTMWAWWSVASADMAMEEGTVSNPINLGEWRVAGLADGYMNGFMSHVLFPTSCTVLCDYVFSMID